MCIWWGKQSTQLVQRATSPQNDGVGGLLQNDKQTSICDSPLSRTAYSYEFPACFFADTHNKSPNDPQEEDQFDH